MIVLEGMSFDAVCRKITMAMHFHSDAMRVDTGEWQAIRNPDLPMTHTIEMQDVSLVYPIPEGMDVLQKEIEPNLPWAEDHFQERVSGQPLNPPPSHEWWPYAQKNNTEHIKDQVFSHTYPERIWPKMANVGETRPNGRQVFVPHNGIRYEYGDLDDVVDMLIESPGTRQAYLPIWFPEDTGAQMQQRVPCTLGYHFLIRQNQLHVTYYIRSCDFYRHFRDDVYMAARLAQWVIERINKVRVAMNLKPGRLTMHMVSLHVFQGDMPRLEREVSEYQAHARRHSIADC